MVSGKVRILSESGLHLRPASKLSNLCILYPCKIELRSNSRTVNAKSVLGVLSACIRQGDEVELICEGEQEEEAFLAVYETLNNDLD